MRPDDLGPEELEMILRALEWTPAQVARELQVDASTIYTWTSETRAPSGPARQLLRRTAMVREVVARAKEAGDLTPTLEAVARILSIPL